MCKKYLDHGNKKQGGCNKKDCPDHHPPMCFSSLKNGTCFQSSCKRRHVKNTCFQKMKKQQPVVTNDTKKDKIDTSVERNASSADSENNQQIMDFLSEALEKMKQDIFKEMDARIQANLTVPMQRSYWQMQPKPMYSQMPMSPYPFTQTQK